MTARQISADEAISLAARGALADTYGTLLQLDRQIDPALLGPEPVVAIGADVLADDAETLQQIFATVHSSPNASAASCVLLRTTQSLDVAGRFALESATYSALQAGPEFARWRANRVRREPTQASNPPHESDAPEASVLTDRRGDVLHIQLNRPDHGNAVDVFLRDQLTEALSIALVDQSITSIQLTGSGPNFCTGGDLDVFDTFNSPGEAHIVRLQRSPARMLANTGTLTHAFVHGKCIGSGIELAAFAARVTATPDATFGLPELALGLVPGAGGTISIVDRIGTQRTAWLLLTQQRIDTQTALEWGLIDAVNAPLTGPLTGR